MSRVIGIFLTVLFGVSTRATAADAAWWVAPARLTVYSEPIRAAATRGRIGANEPFSVLEIVGGPGCAGQGWALVEGGAYACLETATPSDTPPVHLPRLIAFAYPDPTEWDTYLQTMQYNRQPEGGVSALVPFIYAKRWRGWRAPTYASAAAFSAGAAPLSRLGGLRKYHFIRTETTDRGTVLVRANGQVVPLDQVHIYPLSKFHGWNLTQEPVPDGMLPAWAIGYEGTPVRTAPRSSAPIGRTLSYHTPLLVADAPVKTDGHWWVLPDGLGPGRPGYVNDQNDVRHWVPSPPPPGIGSDERWLDVDLGQQVMAIRRGPSIEFVTLVSTGAKGWSTPHGLFRIQDKTVFGDMQSRPDAEDPYHVEKVPWVTHFWPRYAIHGVFWHWGFGRRASHGCINMSVRDARYVFEHIQPSTYDGWTRAISTDADPGTTLRIRHGLAPVRDRRATP